MNDIPRIRDGLDSPAESRLHGQAALLLVESLIHALVARNVVDVAGAIEVVDIAASVGDDSDAEVGRSMRQSISALLTPIANSLRFDLPG